MMMRLQPKDLCASLHARPLNDGETLHVYDRAAVLFEAWPDPLSSLYSEHPWKVGAISSNLLATASERVIPLNPAAAV